MSALSKLVQKKDEDRTALEKAVILYDSANEAADELAALQAELAYFRGAFRSSAKKYADMVERQKA